MGTPRGGVGRLPADTRTPAIDRLRGEDVSAPHEK